MSNEMKVLEFKKENVVWAEDVWFRLIPADREDEVKTWGPGWDLTREITKPDFDLLFNTLNLFRNNDTYCMYNEVLNIINDERCWTADHILPLHILDENCEGPYTVLNLPIEYQREIFKQFRDAVNWHRGNTILNSHGYVMPLPSIWIAICRHVGIVDEDPYYIAEGVASARLTGSEGRNDYACALVDDWLAAIKVVCDEYKSKDRHDQGKMMLDQVYAYKKELDKQIPDTHRKQVE